MSAVVIHRERDLMVFARQVMPFLMQREAQHNVMLGLFAVLQASPPSEPPYLAWAECEGEVAGVAMRTPPFRLLLAHGMTEDVIKAIACDLHGDIDSLAGVLGGVA